MAKKTADDAARELLFRTTAEREAHARAVQEVLARNASMRTNDDLIEEELRNDPAFRAEWQRTVAELELGDVNPSTKTLTQISEQLGIELAGAVDVIHLTA